LANGPADFRRTARGTLLPSLGINDLPGTLELIAGTPDHHFYALAGITGGSQGVESGVRLLASRLQSLSLGRITRQVITKHSVRRSAFARRHFGNDKQRLQPMHCQDAGPCLTKIMQRAVDNVGCHRNDGDGQRAAQDKKETS
jgi:hypothetical protein